MPYSSVWMRAPFAIVASMIGSIVIGCTLASMCRTTGPPRWIRPRMGGLSFSRVPRPGAPASLRRRPSRPFWPRPRAGPCARPPRKPRRPPPHPPAGLLELWPRGHGADAPSGLHVRGVEAEFCRDLPVREVQAHKVEAQHPHPQRLMVSGQPLDEPVSRHMTAKVITCTRSCTVSEIMEIMTDQRVRHVPVIENGRLGGIISIGDIIKHRLGEMEAEKRAMDEYS